MAQGSECKWCHKAIVWSQNDGRWRALNSDGSVHWCSERNAPAVSPAPFKPEPTTEELLLEEIKNLRLAIEDLAALVARLMLQEAKG